MQGGKEKWVKRTSHEGYRLELRIRNPEGPPTKMNVGFPEGSCSRKYTIKGHRTTGFWLFKKKAWRRVGSSGSDKGCWPKSRENRQTSSE